MKKFFLISIVVLLSSASFAQVEMFGAGIGTKIHRVEFGEVSLTQSTIGAIFEFGHEFEGEGTMSKSITAEVFAGTLVDDLISKSLKNAFATELIAKFNLDQAHKENPLGIYSGISFGHMSLLPVDNASDKEELSSILGHEGYDEFTEMAHKKKRISESYMDVEIGGSWELDGLKFEASYGVIHGSIGFSIKYSLKH